LAAELHCAIGVIGLLGVSTAAVRPLDLSRSL